MTRSTRPLLLLALLYSLPSGAAACSGRQSSEHDAGVHDGGADGALDGSQPDGASDAPLDSIDDLPIGDAMPPPGSFCALPGSVVSTAQGPRVVPGGKSAPSLSWLNVPVGFCAHYFATVPTTRQLRFAPDGHLFAASPTMPTTGGANNGFKSIVVLPDDDHDGNADGVVTYLGNLPSTQGLLFSGGYFYFQDGVTIRRTAFKSGDLAPSGPVEAFTTVTAMQAPEHWPKMLDVDRSGTLYVTNGSTQSQICQQPAPVFGAIFKSDGSGNLTEVAMGFRNPIALRCEADHDTCLAAELSLDYSGDNGGREKIVPVHQGDDWGYPCCASQNLPYQGVMLQGGGTPNCSATAPESAAFIIGETPFGIAFETGKWPAPWTNRAMVTLHGVFGTWQGARVVALALDPSTGVPLPATDLADGGDGPNMMDLATGWDDLKQDHGRPAAVEFAPDGRLFLGDDQLGAVVWIAPIDLKP